MPYCVYLIQLSIWRTWKRRHFKEENVALDLWNAHLLPSPWLTDWLLSLWCTFYIPSFLFQCKSKYSYHLHFRNSSLFFSFFLIVFNFIILQIYPATGSESWNKTSLLGTKTLKMKALMETSSRVITMIHKIWGSVDRNWRQD